MFSEEECFMLKFRSHILPQQLLDMGQMEVYYGFTHYCWLKIKATHGGELHDIPFSIKLAALSDEVYYMPENNCLKNRHIPSDELQYQRINPIIQMAIPNLHNMTACDLGKAEVFKELLKYVN